MRDEPANDAATTGDLATTENRRQERPPERQVPSNAPVAHEEHGRGEPSLNRLSVSATLHCMTGCLIGDVIGMTIATALGWGNGASIALAVSLAFVFGYALTSLPLFKAGLALGAIILLAVPGAAHAHINTLIYWTSMLGGFVIAFPFAFAVNRALLSRGKGHALVHEYHH